MDHPLLKVIQGDPTDAAVLRPIDPQLDGEGDRYRGFALSCGINPRYGTLDPYAMAWAAIRRGCVWPIIPSTPNPADNAI